MSQSFSKDDSLKREKIKKIQGRLTLRSVTIMWTHFKADSRLVVCLLLFDKKACVTLLEASPKIHKISESLNKNLLASSNSLRLESG